MELKKTERKTSEKSNLATYFAGSLMAQSFYVYLIYTLNEPLPPLSGFISTFPQVIVCLKHKVNTTIPFFRLFLFTFTLRENDAKRMQEFTGIAQLTQV